MLLARPDPFLGRDWYFCGLTLLLPARDSLRKPRRAGPYQEPCRRRCTLLGSPPRDPRMHCRSAGPAGRGVGGPAPNQRAGGPAWRLMEPWTCSGERAAHPLACVRAPGLQAGRNLLKRPDSAAAFIALPGAGHDASCWSPQGAEVLRSWSGEVDTTGAFVCGVVCLFCGEHCPGHRLGMNRLQHGMMSGRA